MRALRAAPSCAVDCRLRRRTRASAVSTPQRATATTAATTGTIHVGGPVEAADAAPEGGPAALPVPTTLAAPATGTETVAAAGGTPVAAAAADRNAPNSTPGDDADAVAAELLQISANLAMNSGGRANPAFTSATPHATTSSITIVGGDGVDAFGDDTLLALVRREHGPGCMLTASWGATLVKVGSPAGLNRAAIATSTTGTPRVHASPRRKRTPR